MRRGIFRVVTGADDSPRVSRAIARVGQAWLCASGLGLAQPRTSPGSRPSPPPADAARPLGVAPAPAPRPATPAPATPSTGLPRPNRPGSSPQQTSSQRGHGRLFQPHELGMLEGPDREAWQRPEQIMDALGIGDGSVVADLGAGGGWFTVRLAKRVGPNGLVYAEDIQPQMIEAIQRRVQREGLRNVETVLGAADHPSLPRAQLDAALMVETLYEVEDRQSLLTNVLSALKPGGRLGIVEYRPDGGGPGPGRDQRLPSQQVIRAAEAAGLRFVREEQFLPYQYLLVFTR
jgi:SAM-dependent methyltransferase